MILIEKTKYKKTGNPSREIETIKKDQIENFITENRIPEIIMLLDDFNC